MMRKVASSGTNARATTSRTTVVQVRADWVSDAFTRVFTPTKPTPTVSVDYKGRALRKSSKPFRDGYVASANSKPRRAAAPTAAPAEATASVDAEEDNGPFAYLSGAIKRIMSNNFTSDETARGTGLSGLKGNIRQARRSSNKGYHSTKF